MGGRGPDTHPGKSQVTICFLRNSGTDLFEKQLDPRGIKLFFEGVRTVPCEILDD